MSDSIERIARPHIARLPLVRQNEYVELLLDVATYRDMPPRRVVSDIPRVFPYTAGAHLMRPVLHIGQRKLFLSEVQFLTQYAEGETLVVYAGAAPSNHTGYLSELFPHVRFLLVDPNRFNVFDARPKRITGTGEALVRAFVRSRASICTHEGLFTQAIADALGELGDRNVLFISDIRTNVLTNTPEDLDVIWNLAQQYNWVIAARPRAYMLKFRHPYRNDVEAFRVQAATEPYAGEFARARDNGIDFVADYLAGRLRYLTGEIRIQAWAGHISTEARLVGTGVDVRDHGSAAEYESRFFYYNTIERGFGHHVNPAADRRIGFDHCGDCALEYAIWHDFDPAANVGQVREWVKTLSRRLGNRPLKADSHGTLYAPLTATTYRAMFEHEAPVQSRKRLTQSHKRLEKK